MPDKFQDTYPVTPDFSSGESLSATKLSRWAQQIDAGLTRIEYALGDLYSKSWPYFATATTPIGTWAFRQDGIAVTGANRHLQILNLARLIGPASALNPRISPLLTARTVTAWELPDGVVEFYLPFVPTNGTVVFSDAVVFATAVGDPEDIRTAGDYHVDYNTGHVHTFSHIGFNDPTVTVTFDVNVEATNISDSYSGSTPNVIPDPNQTATRCTVAVLPSGRYRVTFPTITHQQNNWNELSSTLLDPAGGAEDLNFGQTPTLPEYFATEFAAGGQIPEGFVMLWDNTAGTYVNGCTFYYHTQTSIDVATSYTVVTGSDRYSIVVASTDICRTLDFVRWRTIHHTHEHGDGSQPVSHSNLAGLIGTPGGLLDPAGGTMFPCVKSAYPNNDHPQYISRFGYTNTYDGGESDAGGIGPNWGGAVMGDLRFSHFIGLVSPTSAFDKTVTTSYGVEFITSSSYLKWGRETIENATTRPLPGGSEICYGMRLLADDDPDEPNAHYYLYGQDGISAGNTQYHILFGDLFVARQAVSGPVSRMGRATIEAGIISGNAADGAVGGTTSGYGEYLKWWSGEGNLTAAPSSHIPLTGTGAPPDLTGYTILGFSVLLQDIGPMGDSDRWFPPGMGDDGGPDDRYYEAILDEGLDPGNILSISIENVGTNFTPVNPYRLVVWYY